MARLLLITSFLAAFLLSPRPLVGASPIVLKTHPNGGYILEGDTLPVTLTIERHKDNRLVIISIDCTKYYAQSEIPLDGEDSPITFNLGGFRGLPEGMCQAVAVLFRKVEGKTSPKTFQVQSPVVYVIGVGPS
jgi:hypothetical protein